MAQISFTQHLRAVGPGGASAYDGATLREVLEAVARDYPLLKAYILDDQGRIRKHVAVFIDGELKRGQSALAAPVSANSDIYVMQALSGG